MDQSTNHQKPDFVIIFALSAVCTCSYFALISGCKSEAESQTKDVQSPEKVALAEREREPNKRETELKKQETELKNRQGPPLAVVKESPAQSGQVQLVDIHGIAIDDEVHRGKFWDAMRKAGFKRIAKAHSNQVQAEIWAIKQRHGELEFGWILFTRNLNLRGKFVMEMDGTLTHSAGTIPQRSHGGHDTFTLSDRMVVYGPLMQQLKPPPDLWILTQGFPGQVSKLKGPLSVATILKFTQEDTTLTLNFKANKIPLGAVEK